MGRKVKSWCCDHAHRCSWANKCKHAKPHNHRKSCDTPCPHKVEPFKCVEVNICKKCDGIGYAFRGMKK